MERMTEPVTEIAATGSFLPHLQHTSWPLPCRSIPFSECSIGKICIKYKQLIFTLQYFPYICVKNITTHAEIETGTGRLACKISESGEERANDR